MLAGDFERAEEQITSIEGLRVGNEKIFARAIQRELARIALDRGDIDEATRLLGTAEDNPVTTELREAAFEVEVRTRVRMHSSEWIPSDREMYELLRLHRRVRRLADHDLFVLMLVEALARRNEIPRMTRLVDYYLTNCRRERTPIMPQLRRALEALSIPIPMQVRQRSSEIS
jgi:hypothetical protein